MTPASQLHVSDSRTACRADGKPNLSSEAFSKIFITSTAGVGSLLVGIEHGTLTSVSFQSLHQRLLFCCA